MQHLVSVRGRADPQNIIFSPCVNFSTIARRVFIILNCRPKQYNQIVCVYFCRMMYLNSVTFHVENIFFLLEVVSMLTFFISIILRYEYLLWDGKDFISILFKKIYFHTKNIAGWSILLERIQYIRIIIDLLWFYGDNSINFQLVSL